MPTTLKHDVAQRCPPCGLMISANCRSFRLVHRALNSASRLLNDLISPREHRGRHIEPERLGGLEIDHQLVLDGGLHRKVGRLFALEYAIDVARPLDELSEVI